MSMCGRIFSSSDEEKDDISVAEGLSKSHREMPDALQFF